MGFPSSGEWELSTMVLIAFAKQDGSVIDEPKHKILHLGFVHCTGSRGSMCAGLSAPLTGQVQDRSAPVAKLQCAMIMPCFSRADCDTPELF